MVAAFVLDTLSLVAFVLTAVFLVAFAVAFAVAFFDFGSWCQLCDHEKHSWCMNGIQTQATATKSSQCRGHTARVTPTGQSMVVSCDGGGRMWLPSPPAPEPTTELELTSSSRLPSRLPRLSSPSSSSPSSPPHLPLSWLSLFGTSPGSPSSSLPYNWSEETVFPKTGGARRARLERRVESGLEDMVEWGWAGRMGEGRSGCEIVIRGWMRG